MQLIFTCINQLRKAIIIHYAVGILLIMLPLTACNTESTPKLTIAAAANMQFALQELITVFTEESGISCELVTGASGMLTSQVAEGAPYHILMSADMAYPEYLFSKGYTIGRPLVYAQGTLVLWSVSAKELPAIPKLASKAGQIIAIANPETAPYGRAAVDVLKYYGVYESLKDQLVYGESIAQTNQFIASGAVYAGITAKSAVKAAGLKKKGSWQKIDPASYHPISQGLVILKTNKAMEKKAYAFKAFLLSSSGRRILEKYGYVTPNKKPI
jgi:molybdate transport system substrate-binding protein